MDVLTFTVHRRPFYLRPTLEAWRRVRGVRDWTVYFHIDASDQVDAQVKIVRAFADWHGDAHLCVHAETFGVLANPLHAMTHASRYGAERTVLAEEDVEPANDALEYLSWALGQPNLLAACAWSDALLYEPNTARRRRWFNPWLWGTTAKMWDEVICPTWDYDYSSADDRGPGGWDCNLGLRVVNDRELDVMFPTASRSRHVGKHLGVHQDPNLHGDVEMPESFEAHRDPVEWKELSVGTVR